MTKKNFLFLIVFILGANGIAAQTYSPVDKASTVKVIIKNLGMGIDGKLSGLEGEIHFNPADLKIASFSVSIDANTISTGIDVRDSALLTDEYLAARSFPRISFVSRQIGQPNKAGPFIVKGVLTLKGISKEISFPFTAVPQNDGMLFTGEFRINRLDFKIAPASTVLSNNMTVSLMVFAKKN